MKSALIENGVVINMILGQIDGAVPCGDEAAIGWIFDDGVFLAPTRPDTEHIVPPPPTAESVRAECARRMAGLVAQYKTEERETWPMQVAEAQAVLAGRAGEAIMLPLLAAARGLTVQVFAGAVLQTANATKAATAQLLAAQARMLAMPAIPADYTLDAWWV